MDINAITEFINTTGFPICSCIALYYMNREQLKCNANMMRTFQESIEANTKAISDLEREVKK